MVIGKPAGRFGERHRGAKSLAHRRRRRRGPGIEPGERILRVTERNQHRSQSVGRQPASRSAVADAFSRSCAAISPTPARGRFRPAHRPRPAVASDRPAAQPDGGSRKHLTSYRFTTIRSDSRQFDSLLCRVPGWPWLRAWSELLGAGRQCLGEHPSRPASALNRRNDSRRRVPERFGHACKRGFRDILRDCINRAAKLR